jgi:hypothetical protein
MTSTEKTIIKAINKDIADDLRNVQIYNAVLNALQKFVGKDVTKRVVAPVEVALGQIGSFTVWYSSEYSWQALTVVDKKAEKQYKFTLHYHSQGKEFKVENFEKHNACYGYAAEERIKKNQDLLNNPARIAVMANAIDQLNDAKKVLKSYQSYDIPALYEIQRETETKWD